MVMTVLNSRAVQPFVQVQNMAVKSLTTPIPRGAYEVGFDVQVNEPVTELTLPALPTHPQWVEVYVDGFRLHNATLDFGDSYEAYEIVGQKITFKEPVGGRIDIIADRPWTYVMPEANYIRVSNVQGAKTIASNPGDLFAAYFCEPLILTLPTNGYVKLTDDHLDLVYVPNSGFEGYDAFSYSVITDRGQLADPKCVYVKVGDPKKPTDPEPPVEP
jgi:hypothetical protein